MSSTESTESQEQQPSLIGGHAQYVKGAAENLIGNLTGSDSWTASGASDTDAGISEMKAASANRDPQTQGYGKVEEVAGKISGCEGMEKEGAVSQKKE